VLGGEFLRNTGPSFLRGAFRETLGSNGSVFRLFKRQDRSGGAGDVTQPEMQRFFMGTIRNGSVGSASRGDGSGAVKALVLNYGGPRAHSSIWPAKMVLLRRGFKAGSRHSH